MFIAGISMPPKLRTGSDAEQVGDRRGSDLFRIPGLGPPVRLRSEGRAPISREVVGEI
jgi:hypothetical protein